MDLNASSSGHWSGRAGVPKKKDDTKEQIVIELDDSDTDIEKPSTSKKDCSGAEIVLDKNKKNSPNENKQEIECIDIGESSDDEEEERKKLNKENHPTIEAVSEGDQKNSDKVDYLNLTGTESEEEQEVIQDSVNTLLTSAAILNDIPFGPAKPVHGIAACSNDIPSEPEKPVERIEIQINAATNTVNKSDSDSLSSKCHDISSKFDNKINKSENSSTALDKSLILNDSSGNKRFKRDTETPISTISDKNTDFCENEELGMQSSFMYRKDERITGAFAKSVCRLPRQITRHYASHVKVITALHWCIPQYSHLLLSASADCTVKIWDIYCRHPVQSLKTCSALKAAKWSNSGEQIVAGGYGKKAYVFDVLSGKEIISYDVFHYVSSIENHPYMEDVFLVGTRNVIFGFDLRVHTTLPIRTFPSKCEEVLDIAFLDENEFVCSTSVVSRDSADRTIMVWDFSSGAIMSNQIYLELYTCPSLKVHPSDSCFIAQTSGDYIAAFETHKPYKIKDKRYMGHKVSSYGIECDISPDGKYVASGDANGDIYFYNYASTNEIIKLTARQNVPANRVKWHPALNSTVATATWDGHIQIWK